KKQSSPRSVVGGDNVPIAREIEIECQGIAVVVVVIDDENARRSRSLCAVGHRHSRTAVTAACPLCPHQRAKSGHRSMSAKGQEGQPGPGASGRQILLRRGPEGAVTSTLPTDFLADCYKDDRNHAAQVAAVRRIFVRASSPTLLA